MPQQQMSPEHRALLIRRLRKVLQVTPEQVSDEQLLHDSQHTLTRAFVEYDVALDRVKEALVPFTDEVKDLAHVIERELTWEWSWRLRLFFNIVDLQLTKTWRAAWRWSRDDEWADYYLRGLTPIEALKEEHMGDRDE